MHNVTLTPKQTALILIPLVAGAAVGYVWQQQAAERERREAEAQRLERTRALEAARAAIPQKRCPVMNAKIDPDRWTEYRGHKVYFCCDGCSDRFSRDPERYLSKLQVGDEAAPGAAESDSARTEPRSPPS